MNKNKLSMKPKRYPDLSIIIPALREERRIGRSLDELSDFLTRDKVLAKLVVEVIVVAADGGDKTKPVVLSKKNKFKDLKLLSPGKVVGKGRDVAYGMVRAKGDLSVFMDADIATPLKYISKFYLLLTQNDYDIVIATRNLRKHHKSLLRRLLSNLGNIAFRLVCGIWVEDSQCGFKMFTRQAAETCFNKLTISGWGFDMEILAIAKIHKLKIKSVRINDWVSVTNGTFTDSPLKGALNSLIELGKIKINKMNHKYK